MFLRKYEEYDTGYGSPPGASTSRPRTPPGNVETTAVKPFTDKEGQTGFAEFRGRVAEPRRSKGIGLSVGHQRERK